ncbi:hypothetical protein BG011_000785 [Mortierella polycephala]|uniref:Myb-like, SWIRM and MPN domain-containing protein 1 n=1 Tax=Mortierella polycephala TaxID=41804 RepID=A0A9P6U5P9_9FUNG|nr:hypothetical protein BG011_000785 [Mortierella polycephala]
MPPKKSTTSGSKPSKKQKLNDSSSSDAGRGEKVLSKEEEEEMSSALIAQLLAQEGGGDQHGYYAEYNNDINYGSLGNEDYSDDDDDYRNDYSYRPKSRSKRSAAQPKKKAKRHSVPASTPAPKPQPTSESNSSPLETSISTAASGPDTLVVASSIETPVPQQTLKNESSTPTASQKTSPAVASKSKKVKENAPGMNTGVYSEEEERAFVEALDIFGRNWRSVEEHVKTRDSNSIRSHAQKHFIKLFRDNIPLPAKILESGPGYTLSGNDLDPYSAAARPYLSQRLLDDPSLLPAQGGTRFNSQSSAASKAEKAAQAKEKKANGASENEKEIVKDAVKEMKELKIRKATKPTKEASRRAESPPAESVFAGRTDYSKARLRNTRERSSITFRQMASDLDPLTMVKCEPFCGQPNSGVVGCQPFGIKVQSNVLLGMDFHAHLMTAEIIGFLAGDWIPATKTIHIKAIFPCRSLPTGQNHVNVEMDPTSEFEVRQEIAKRNMRIVGWYHSHPTFTPDPSLVDIENQTSYQSLFKDGSMDEEPFVGAIVGPYDERLPGLSSVINWFYISQTPQERGHPKRLLYDLIEDTELPEEESASWTKLFDEYRDSPERTNFKEQWRQQESETKLQKMLISLGRRMPWLRNILLVSKDGADTTEAEPTSVPSPNDAIEQPTESTPAEQPTGSAPTEQSAESMTMNGTNPVGESSSAGESMMEDVQLTSKDVPGMSDSSLARCDQDLKRTPSTEGGSSGVTDASETSSSGKSIMGLSNLTKDPFLIRVEQELASWQPVVG